mmetsp:Transcript_28333/g.91694  ORF Transcript_28333/g.91694 Transcript_28333/m.91694 type:complete len:168 (-) Transcript_28333:424-927(-)
MNFAAGMLFGILPGAAIMNVGCVVGSMANFFIGRYVAREWARKRLQESPTLSALEAALQKRAVFIITLARLSPVFPFAMVGYALGASAVTMRDFAVGTAVGLFPGCILYSWIGVSMKDMSSKEGGGAGSWISIMISVASTIAISIYAKRVYDDAVKDSSRTAVNKRV